MEEKKMPTWLIILLIVVGLCLIGFGIWYGINYSKNLGEPEGPTPEPSTEEPIVENVITCGGEKYDIEIDSVQEVSAGTAWTGGEINIKYNLNDPGGNMNNLYYTLNGETKILSPMCEYLFEIKGSSLGRTGDVFPAGICKDYDGRYFELGLAYNENSDDNYVYQPTDFYSYTENITEYCK